MRRLDEHEEMMERIEAKLDVLMSRMVEKDKAKQARPFIDYIKDPERAPEILAQMHRWIDKAYRVDALIYIQAALDAKVFNCKPPFPV